MIPHARVDIDSWLAARAAHGRMLVALDFDGTLAPIAPRPDDAALPARARNALGALATRRDTQVAVISGRGLADVAAKVGIPSLYYAGNHGLEIRGHGVERRHPEAVAARPAIHEAAVELRARLGSTPGVLVEDKGLSLSVHYRLVQTAEAEIAVREAVREVCTAIAGVRAIEGKKIIELRPAVDWNKGHALEFLIATILDVPAAPVLFIGDDVTDEDAFRVLRGAGAGIIVAHPPPPGTAATHWLASPEEVAELLRQLADAHA